MTRYCIYSKDRSFPCMVLEASSDGAARRLALLLGPKGGIRRVELVKGG